jgi:NADP-dependent aldehyde dehydrogenase
VTTATTLGHEASHRPRSGAVADGPARTSPTEIQAALAAAAACATQVAEATPRERTGWVESVAAAEDAAGEELVALADEETALGTPRLSGELGRGAANMRYYASVGERGDWLRVRKQRLPGPPEIDLRRANLPIGPVAVFGASNFPFQFGVLGHDTCSALAAGCPVVAKAHPAHPTLSVRLGELARNALAEAGAPEGAFAVVVGFDAGLALVDSPLIQAVAFTGSQRGGMALVERARQRPQPIPVYAEMGSVNPVLVTRAAAARMGAIAEEFVGAVNLGAGQFCTKPGLLLTPRGTGGPGRVAANVATADGVWLLSDGIAAAYSGGIADMERAGATVLARGGSRPEGYGVPPTVLEVELEALTRGSRLLEECFGPVAIVAEYDRLEDAFDVLGRMQPSLVGAIYAGGDADPDLAPAVARLTRQTGRVVVDGSSTGVACVDAMHHGGPWPSTSHPATTSVGAEALARFTRPVAFQNVPDPALPPALRDGDPWGIGGGNHGTA